MLKTMLWQAALAALLIGGAAAGYAQVRDTGYLAAPRDAAQVAPSAGKDSKRDHDRDHDKPRRADRQERRHD